jgi:hypothetical protein
MVKLKPTKLPLIIALKFAAFQFSFSSPLIDFRRPFIANRLAFCLGSSPLASIILSLNARIRPAGGAPGEMDGGA